MKVIDLCCSRDHRFEGWYSSEDDYTRQSDGGLLTCPICEDTAVRRLPSAPYLSRGRSTSEAASVPEPHEPTARNVQAEWMRRMRQLIDQTEDVGDRFASEARRIHYGESEERGIRGEATLEQASALREEGIEILSLPMPAALKEPLQ